MLTLTRPKAVIQIKLMVKKCK